MSADGGAAASAAAPRERRRDGGGAGSFELICDGCGDHPASTTARPGPAPAAPRAPQWYIDRSLAVPSCPSHRWAPRTSYRSGPGSACSTQPVRPPRPTSAAHAWRSAAPTFSPTPRCPSERSAAAGAYPTAPTSHVSSSPTSAQPHSRSAQATGGSTADTNRWQARRRARGGHARIPALGTPSPARAILPLAGACARACG